LSATAPRTKRVRSAKSSVSSEETAGISVSPGLFEKFQQLIHQETGIWLADHKMALLCGRLSRRLRAFNMSALDEYYDLVTQPDQEEERVLMIDAITTNETRFFRDARHFDFLEQRVIPLWLSEAEHGLRHKAIRIWSAACSSGEEPYSLAMLLAKHLPVDQGWNVTILATDISTRMLALARAGTYPIAKSSEIPPDLLKEHMLRGIDHRQGEMKVMPEIQTMIDFGKLNLVHSPYPAEQFDAIFCRNVLIYFDPQTKQQVVERLTSCLAPNGLLFVGQAENLSTMNSALRSIVPAVYTQAGARHGS
jgi:chemotaxis protein methyltransferase CheR